MKKYIFLVVIIITTFFILYNKTHAYSEEVRGVFISYIEYQKYLKNKNEKEINSEIDNIFTNIRKYSINTLYLQVRMFSDSIYPSKIFPYTTMIGNGNNIDVLSIFLKKAHKYNIKVYAWINPYRISNFTDTSIITKDNPAYKYLNTNHIKIIEGKGIYYNPASIMVNNLIIAGVIEVIRNYNVNGIIFDDYFYPNDDIDLEEYKKYQNTISITDFRLNNINKLISEVYKTIKEINPNMEFGVSPDGNIDNNYNLHYADVKKWLSEDGYIDFIMPQIYYGFNHETTPFIKTINSWNDLIKNDVKLIPALALYKSGNRDIYAKSGEDEWMNNSNIIRRQIEVSRTLSSYSGFCLFRTEYLLDYKNDCLSDELNQIKKLLKK